MTREHTRTLKRTGLTIVQKCFFVNEVIEASFNDIELVANPGDTPAAIVARYNIESARKAEAYRNSPEGKRVAAKRTAETRRLQKVMDDSIVKLETLDFSNFNAVLGWLEEVQDASDRVDVQFNPKEIVDKFRANGFKPNVNTGKAFDENDEENFARYIVGQALDFLQNHGLIHHLVTKFTNDWRVRFGYSVN